MMAGGWHALFWSLPTVAFLVFMIPLPHFVERAVSGPMQTIATISSTFVLQVLGRPALAEGNVILLNDIELGIVEACSGLRMLVVFYALSTGVALLIRKPLWEKLLLACSAFPIALVSNVMRIVLTGLCYEIFGDHFGGDLFHDLAGWLMMPLGLVFLGIEMWILHTLLIERTPNDALAAQITLQRVEANPVSLYRGPQTNRRAKKEIEPEAAPAPEAEAEPVTVTAE
jgi:exosortase